MKQFTSAKKWLGDVDAQSAAKLLTAAADVALIISPSEPYLVKDVAFGSDEVANEVGSDWIGRPWSELVAVESRPKVAELLRDAVADEPPRWRHINHLSSRPDVLPILYSVTRIGTKGRIVALGRSLRPITTLQQRLLATQQTMDREYSQLRMAETRHRLLFQVCDEAVLIVDATTRKVVEANPAAGRLLDQAPGPLVHGLPGLDQGRRQLAGLALLRGPQDLAVERAQHRGDRLPFPGVDGPEGLQGLVPGRRGRQGADLGDFPGGALIALLRGVAENDFFVGRSLQREHRPDQPPPCGCPRC